jgi:hypothetical protein
LAKSVDLSDGHLEVRGGLDDQQLGAVPAKRGVVTLLGEGDIPLLMLTAADMRSRLRNRLAEAREDKQTRSADLREVTRKVLWRLTHSHFETDLQYLEAARAVWPARYASLLAWKPAWFVHVDPTEEYPRFVRTRQAGQRSGRYFGPFPDGRSADRFVDALEDVFSLCRDYRCLRQAPHAQPCAYAQMGRCHSPCDGGISMDEYRGIVARATEFVGALGSGASGQPGAMRAELAESMRASAKALRFEEAASLKARFERLDVFESPACHWVAPLEQFRFVAVQSGGSTRKARAFVVYGGLVEPGGELEYPLKPTALRKVLRRLGMLQGAVTAPIDPMGRLRIGLVARYLLSSPDRQGLIVRWDADMTELQLQEAIEHAAKRLKLRAPKPRRKTAAGAEGKKRRPAPQAAQTPSAAIVPESGGCEPHE